MNVNIGKKQKPMIQKLNVAVGGNVRKYRNLVGISQDTLSKKASLALNTITKIESGVTSSPRIGTLQKIADVLGVSVIELLREPKKSKAVKTQEVSSVSVAHVENPRVFDIGTLQKIADVQGVSVIELVTVKAQEVSSVLIAHVEKPRVFDKSDLIFHAVIVAALLGLGLIFLFG